jgi:hypothetical protein
MSLSRIKHESGRTLIVGACKPIPEGAHLGARLKDHLVRGVKVPSLSPLREHSRMHR